MSHRKVRVAVVYSDGDRSGTDSWMVSIKIGKDQFNGDHLDKKDDAMKLAKSVASNLGVGKVEYVEPLWG